MAKVVVTVDTDTKSMSVSIDDVAVPNAKCAQIYQYCDSNGNPNGIDCSVRVVEKQTDNLTKETTYYAMGSAEATKLVNSKAAVYNKDVPNCVGITVESKTQADIAAFLDTKLGKL